VGRLRGRVTDLFTGAGIPNAYVVVSQVNTGRWAVAYTDATGSFQLDNLYPIDLSCLCGWGRLLRVDRLQCTRGGGR
jgi:hypothetical protein